MPTLRSRPDSEDDDEGGNAWTPDEIAGIITDAVLYVMPNDMVQLKLALHVCCRTLWNTEAVDDFYVYENARSGCDVGFKLFDDPHYHVIQIN